MLFRTLPCLALLALGLGGCASLPPADDRGSVIALSQRQGLPWPDAAAIQPLTESLLAQPLTAASATQLALLHNPAVADQFATLGIAGAELVSASRPANPRLSLSRLSPGDAAAPHAQLGIGVALDLASLLLLPAHRDYAEARYEAARMEAAAATLRLAAEVDAAWVQLVGSQQRAELQQRIADAGQASAELAAQLFAAGNLNRRELAQEQAAAAQARLDALAADADRRSARLDLQRRMGLPADRSPWRVDARLAELPDRDPSLAELMTTARHSHLDLLAANRNAEALAQRYGFTRRTRWVGGVEVGVERERDFDGSINVGPTLELELPLFHWGGGRQRAAQAAWQQAEAALDTRVLDVEHQLQLAHAQLTAARLRAEGYRDALIPQRTEVVKLMQLEHNYMLVGAFELIAARQDEYAAYAGYVEAVRDYWLARAELGAALGRPLPDAGTALQPLDDGLAPASTGTGTGQQDHSMHQGMHQDMHHDLPPPTDTSAPQNDPAAPPAQNPHGDHK